ISLTPNFSWVSRTAGTTKPFQRFSDRARKAVKTAFQLRVAWRTWLKPGVNKGKNESEVSTTTTAF
ncbi:MAG: hypothetical protein ACLQAH_17725, partial [Limisphaerales bacterium]